MPTLDKETRKLLNEKLVELVAEIELNNELWNEMVTRKVITPSQKEDIIRNDRNTNSEQKTLLLRLLPRRGREKFIQFCLALEATEQDHVVTDVLRLDLGQLQTELGEVSELQQQARLEGGDAPPLTSVGAMDTSPASGHSDAPPPQPGTHGSNTERKRPQQQLQPTGLKRPRTDRPPHESEEEDIELTDSWGYAPDPVLTTTEQFYLAHRDPSQVYPMHLACRGLCMIINVSSMGTEVRRGTELDAGRLSYLFRCLHFDVIPYEDHHGLSAAEIIEKVQNFYQLPDHSHYQCSVMVLLSHGSSDCIYGTDGQPVQLSKLYTMMDSCPGLANKPKLVFLECCAGLSYDDGRLAQNSLVGEDEEDAKIPTMADTFIGRPSQPGMRAHRNTKQGSWYVQAIVKVFSKYAATRNLAQLITKVNSVVAQKESRCSDPLKSGKKQMPEARLSLRRDLYFFPGIQRTDP